MSCRKKVVERGCWATGKPTSGTQPCGLLLTGGRIHSLGGTTDDKDQSRCETVGMMDG